jgi:hypothetical protein
MNFNNSDHNISGIQVSVIVYLAYNGIYIKYMFCLHFLGFPLSPKHSLKKDSTAALSSFKMCFGDGGKSLYKYYQNMYWV